MGLVFEGSGDVSGLSRKRREKRRDFWHFEIRRKLRGFGSGETEERKKNVSERKTIENLRFRACRGDFLKHFGCPCILEDSTSPNHF